MVARVSIGRRGLQYGLFASPPGVDVDTAPVADLLLNITSNIDQIIGAGLVTGPFPDFVAFAASPAPIVIITAVNISSVNIRRWPTQQQDRINAAYLRPYPYDKSDNMTVDVTASGFTFRGNSPRCGYVVFRRALNG